MAGSNRPLVVAFDVVGTLVSLEPLGQRFSDAGLPDGALDEWFARFLRDAMALDVAGIYVPFRDIAAATLEVMLVEKGLSATKPTTDTILQAVAELPAHPDVQPAFQLLKDAGVRIMALTNGSAGTTGRLLKRSNLDAFVEQIVSIDDVKHWKPRREVYLHAATAASVTPNNWRSSRPTPGISSARVGLDSSRVGSHAREEVPCRDGNAHRRWADVD